MNTFLSQKTLRRNNIRRSGQQHALAYFHYLRVQGNTKVEGKWGDIKNIDNYKNAESCLDLSKDLRTVFLLEFCDYLQVRHGREVPTEAMLDSTE